VRNNALHIAINVAFIVYTVLGAVFNAFGVKPDPNVVTGLALVVSVVNGIAHALEGGVSGGK
jgi:hypothetical protein